MAFTRIRRGVRAWAVELIPDRGLARRFALLALAQSIGFGVFLTSSVIFFTRTIGLSPAQIGIGLSVANVFGMVFTVPIGRLADRIGARIPLLITYAGLAVLFIAYNWVGDFIAFLVVTSLISIGETSCNPLRMTLTKATFPREQQVRVSSQMRSLFNVGFMVGAMVAGVALAVDSPHAFLAVIVFTALAQAGCAFLVWRLGVPAHVRPAVALGTKVRSGLRDVRFVGLAMLCGVLEFFQPILVVALPLWVVSRTSAPASVTALVLIVDTAMVFVFQVMLSRGAETTGGSARILRRAGFLLAVCCGLFAISEGMDAVPATLILVCGAIVLVLGEISQAAGAFGLSLHLPPEGRQGEYQGVFALGRGMQQTVGPALVTALVIGLGLLGWVVLAGLFLLAGLLTVPLARNAEQHVARQAAEPNPIG
ncbi:MFS transporter [Actinokineospora fastidiosa]|uniref:MFS transporter n=1 Tax=Actinokineospora fastidiosa TaxID=1816 RepID=A0A918LBR4_9PSEU|nr:MFS transporter [Actinokineospora fastidiosa]GGS28851.1 MFS transporter [Actinokineospora fastidiosa]